MMVGLALGEGVLVAEDGFAEFAGMGERVAATGNSVHFNP